MAKDVGGKEVGGELNAAEGAADGSGEAVGEGGFADAWGSFDEDVAACEEGDAEEFSCGFRTEDGGFEAVAELVEGLAGHVCEGPGGRRGQRRPRSDATLRMASG